MPFSTKAVLPYIEGKLTGLTGMQNVQRGEPVGTPVAAVNAFVLTAGQTPLRKAGGVLYQRSGHFQVIFCIAVADEPDDAEDTLGDLIDAFEQAMLADLTAGGLVTDLEIDASLADNPEYRQMYGPEYRTYPVQIAVKQTVRISPTP